MIKPLPLTGNLSADLAAAREHVAYLEKMEAQRKRIVGAGFGCQEELEFATWATENGIALLRSGWPDFLIVTARGHAAMAVEIKAARDHLRESQRAMHDALNPTIPVLVGSAREVAADLRERARYGWSPFEGIHEVRDSIVKAMGRPK